MAAEGVFQAVNSKFDDSYEYTEHDCVLSIWIKRGRKDNERGVSYTGFLLRELSDSISSKNEEIFQLKGGLQAVLALD